MSEAESNKERKAEGAEEPGLPAARDQDPHPLTDQGNVVAALLKTTGGLTHVHLRDVQDEHVTPVVRPKHPDEVDMPGQVDRYQILGEIARGGFGVIYKARDVDVGRDLALKVLLADHEKNPVLVRRFVEEAQIGGQLQHPGIVPVHNMGLVAGGKPYFTMKLVKGQTLAALLGARGDPTEDRLRFLGVFEQVAETLAYAHARKVIHRDLKPANIMVGAFGEVQVMDWGLSKVLDQTRDADRAAAEIARTQISVIETIRTGSSGSDSLAGSVLGTPAYMAPEQARGEVDDLDARADVFGLGAILCEILTGMPPYVADSVNEIHLQAKRGYLDESAERLDACGADKELVSLAKTCLAYEPRERPTDASVVTRKIHEFLASLEERARSSALEAAEAHVRAEGERRARKLSLALAVVLVAVLSVGTRGYLWLEGVSADRLRKASTATSRALEEAVTLHAQAKAAGYLDLARWEAAVTAAEAAGALAAGARPDLQQRTAELVSEARRDVERSRQATALDAKNRRLLDALESLRGDHADNSSYTRNEPGYAAAFSEYGIDIDRLEPQEAAERLAESGIAVELAETLDHWGKSRKSARPRDTEGWKKLFRIGQLLDPDPWRRRLRKALEDEDVDEMRQLVASPELMYASARTLELLGTTLRQWGDHARAEWVYRVARDRYPDDFWINHDLHRFLHNQPFEYAALASRPRSAHAWSDAAALLRAKSDPEDTLAAAIDILKNSDRSEEWQWRALVSVLEKGEGQDFGSTLEGTILWLDRLVSSGGKVHELAGEVFALAWSLRPDVLPASSILEFARAQVRDAGGGDASALAFLAAVHFGMEETRRAT